jgi:hypothetical protein
MVAWNDQIENARRRLKTAYLTHGAGNGGWRRIAAKMNVNLRTVYEFAERGILPASAVIRDVLLRGYPSEPQPMDALMLNIRDELRARHIGEGNAIKTRELLQVLGVSQMSDRQLRHAIEKINHDHQGLICSSPWSGYWWSSGMGDLDAVEAAFHRAKTQLDNAAHLRRNIIREYGGQIPLPAFVENVPETN